VGTANYNSLQTSFQQRLTRGFFLTANYVWSHAFDNSSFDGGADGPVPQDPTNRNADWPSSDSDIHNRVNIYGTYELPFGPGKAFLNSNSLLNRTLLGGSTGERNLCRTIGFTLYRYHQRHSDEYRRICQPRQRGCRSTSVSGKEVGE